MKREIFVGLLATCAWISGCASGGVGLVESPMWHATASTEDKVAHFRKECEAYGYKAGTPEMTQCIQTGMRSSKADAAARMQAIGNATNQNRPVTCTTYGNRTTCQ